MISPERETDVIGILKEYTAATTDLAMAKGQLDDARASVRRLECDVANATEAVKQAREKLISGMDKLEGRGRS